MVFYEIARLRELCLGDATDTSEDTFLNAKGAEADAEIVTDLTVAADGYGKLTSLPAINVSAGTVGGSAASQDIKGASTDRAAAKFFIARRVFDAAKPFQESSKKAVEAYVIRLQYDAEIQTDNV